MATVTKTWSFAADAEGYVATAGAASTLTWDSATGNPAGSLKARILGKGANNTNWWEWAGTWEQLGVPAGATVTAVRLNSGQTYCGEYSKGASSTIGPYELRDSAGTLLGTLWAGRTVTATDAGWVATAAQADVAVPAAQQPSNSTVHIRLADHLVTSASGGGTFAVSTYDDEVSLVITYGGVATTYAATGTATGTSAAAGTASVTHTAAAVSTGASGVAGTATVARSAAATATGSSTAVGTAVIVIPASASSAGSSITTVTATVTYQAVATAMGTGATVGTASVIGQATAYAATGTSSGTSVTAAAATVNRSAAGIADGASSAAGSATALYQATGMATGQGLTYADGYVGHAVAGTVQGTSSAVAAPYLLLSASGVAVGTSALLGTVAGALPVAVPAMTAVVRAGAGPVVATAADAVGYIRAEYQEAINRWQR